ncbi:DinB family protein [bacterium]|nr:DinB family protein [bacterium]MBU1652213.1 DinB family protein [bacterium]
MQLNQQILPEFEQEMAHTRKSVERIPQDKWAWKAHDKSWSIGELTTHLVNIPNWALITMNTESFDVAPPGAEPPSPTPTNSAQEALTLLDKGVADLTQALAQASDDDLMKPWTMLKGGEVLFAMPRLVVLRSFIFNHIIHHRAQLGVYLRLCGVAVPDIYGPTADET